MNKGTSKNTASFYKSISNSYTESIKRCVPFYEEILESIFLFLPEDFKPKKILELGCGTGNLTKLIVQKFPFANITAVDNCIEFIELCKMHITSPIHYIHSDFKEIDFPKNTFDLIVSSISIHHIDDLEKQLLFNKLSQYQTQNGIFSFCDQFNSEQKDIYLKYISEWKAYAFHHGSDQEEWDMWMKHQKEHDYHATMGQHIAWLKSAGYNSVDCTKRHLLWTSLYAQK